MKTHQEIRDAIGPLNEASSLPDEERKLIQILHALNDRIEELEARRERDVERLDSEIRSINPL